MNRFEFTLNYGYATNYSLKLENLNSQNEVFSMGLENLINKAKDNSLSNEEMVKVLTQFKNKGVFQVEVDETFIINELRNFSSEAKYALDEDGDSREVCKWYDHTEDLIKFSINYPTWLFTLSGEGEEAGDVWKLYVLNGKKQLAKAKLTFDDFDFNKLV